MLVEKVLVKPQATHMWSRQPRTPTCKVGKVHRIQTRVVCDRRNEVFANDLLAQCDEKYSSGL